MKTFIVKCGSPVSFLADHADTNIVGEDGKPFIAWDSNSKPKLFSEDEAKDFCQKFKIDNQDSRGYGIAYYEEYKETVAASINA
jgi:hypothetical protein